MRFTWQVTFVSLNLGSFNIIIIIIIIIIFTSSTLLSFSHRLQRHYSVRVSLLYVESLSGHSFYHLLLS